MRKWFYPSFVTLHRRSSLPLSLAVSMQWNPPKFDSLAPCVNFSAIFQHWIDSIARDYDRDRSQVLRYRSIHFLLPPDNTTHWTTLIYSDQAVADRSKSAIATHRSSYPIVSTTTTRLDKSPALLVPRCHRNEYIEQKTHVHFQIEWLVGPKPMKTRLQQNKMAADARD